MEGFNAFWWRVKGRASFSGKGAGVAKRWVLQELEEGPQSKESNELTQRTLHRPTVKVYPGPRKLAL